MEASNYLTNPPDERLNKYEMVIVAAKEARRLNELANQQQREIKGRITHVAMKRFKEGHVKFKYEAP